MAERVSAAIYDAAMVAANRNWLHRDEIAKNRGKVVSRMKEAIDSDVEYEVLIGRGNTAESVKDRIDLLQKILLAS